MARGEPKHLFALAGVRSVHGHRHHPAAARRSTAGGRAHPAATAGTGGRIVRFHRCDEILARAVVNLNRAFQIALGDADHAPVHSAHAHSTHALAAFTQALDHVRALRLLPGHTRLDRDFEIAADWLVGVWLALCR